MYYVFLTCNHKQNNPVLIGVTANPRKLAREWISERSQYKLLEDNEKYLKVLQTNENMTPEKEEYYWNIKHDRNLPLYHHKIVWREVRETGQIYIPLEGSKILEL